MADNTNYYDEVDESAYELSRQNRSVASPESRDLWQSADVDTHDVGGPRTEDVAPVFAQFRADTLANPVTADQDDEALAERNAASAEEAQAEADRIRETPGYVAPTGPDAGAYDDPKLEEAVPAENFSAEPKDEPAEESAAEDANESEEGAASAEGSERSVPEDTNGDGTVDEAEARAATE